MDRYETAAKVLVEEVPYGIGMRGLYADKLREHFPEPGRCGECRWWLGHTGSGLHGESRGCKQKDNSPGVVCHVYTMADFSCPRFERRADKYEELAAELLDKLDRRDYGKLCMAAFLRERVTVRET